jgi:quinol monooxygenase YgiN
MEDENIFCLLEEWDTQKDFEIHRKSECFKILRGAMNLLEEPYEIFFYRSRPESNGIVQPLIYKMGKF